MSVDLLRRAAKVLRDHAAQITDRYEGRRWEVRQYGWPTGRTHYVQAVGDTLIVTDSIHESDMRYVALMDPPVALALADWLNLQADCAGAWPGDMTVTDRAAVALARAILREPEVTP